MLLAALIMFSCDMKKTAVGQFNIVDIFCSKEDRELVEPLLNDFFNESLNLPQPEYLFELQWHNPQEFQSYNNRHNLMVISLVNPQDQSGDLLYDKIAKATGTQDSVIAAFDMYRYNQLYLGIRSYDAYQLKTQLEQYKTWIYDELIENGRRTLVYSAQENGENKSLKNQVQEEFGFNMIIQKDFQIIHQDPDSKFLWIGRGFPYRWLTFHQVNVETIESPEETWKFLEVLLETTLGSVEITNDYRVNELVKYDNRQVPILRGNYFHKQSDTGGPFFTCFLRKGGEEYLLVSGFVNYPGHSKMVLIKQLEAIILDGEFTGGR